MRRRSFLPLLPLLSAAPFLPRTSFAQTFPRKPVKIVVPFPPGGTPDMLSRILGQRASQILKQSVIVENRPGAGGNVAMEVVARSPAGTLAMKDSAKVSSQPVISPGKGVGRGISSIETTAKPRASPAWRRDCP